MNAFLTPPTPVLVISGPAMLAYDHGDHDDEPVRLEAAIAGINDAARAGIPLHRVAARPATYPELQRVHSEAYLAAFADTAADVNATGAELAHRFGLGTRDCPLTPGVRLAALTAAGAAADAAMLTFAASRTAHGELAPHRAFCAVRPPGHHAHAAKAGGYCYLNNAMVAAQTFLDRGAARVFILDLDFHHGDGTASLVAAEPRCAYGSVHASPLIAFPGTGHAGEHPRLHHEPLSRRPKAAWRAAAERLIAAAVEFAPEALVFSFGTDAIAGDPVGDMGVSMDDFIDSYTDALTAFPKLPVVSVLEGGYSVDNLRVAVHHHLIALAT